MPKAAKSLKAQNQMTIVGVVAADALVLFLTAHAAELAQPSTWTVAAAVRLSAALGAPFVVLLLSSLLPPAWKAVLAFWRLKDVLPGHRAFTEHALRDPRVNVIKLTSALGPLPQQPREQNVLWYRLFKAVEQVTEVDEQHRSYLLFRDLAALSALLFLLALAVLPLKLVAEPWLGYAAALFAMQYAVSAVNARNHGMRLVTTVLAIHSARS